MKYIKIICLVLTIVLVTGCGKDKKISDPIKDSIDSINSAKDQVTLTTIDMLIENVQTAYLISSMGNGGLNPTLKQISESFEMDNIEMLEDGTFEFNGKLLDCKSTTDNDNLKVSCEVNGTKKETTVSMPLAK